MSGGSNIPEGAGGGGVTLLAGFDGLNRCGGRGGGGGGSGIVVLTIEIPSSWRDEGGGGGGGGSGDVWSIVGAAGRKNMLVFEIGLVVDLFIV